MSKATFRKRAQIRICNFRSPVVGAVNTCSSAKGEWSRGLSPFLIGPCDLWGKYVSQNVENAWQFSKVYNSLGHVDSECNPTKAWLRWAKAGWSDEKAHRYPMGKGKKPLYSYWDGEKLGYVEARKRIYAPLYAAAVEKTDAFRRLQSLYRAGGVLWLRDYDGYDHVELEMSYEDVLNCESRKMGHAFVLAMMLDGERLWEE